MREADLPAVMEIERAAYEFPWTPGIMRDCLFVGYHCTVYVEAGVISGYGILNLGAGEAHIMNLCTAPHRRRSGIARRLLAHLLQQARTLRAEVALLEVRPSNAAAIALYQACGFCEIGRRPGYYPHPSGREDALMLALPLTEPNP
jgi:ribosomal-protein-alanine N-acetyltransferase